MSKLIDITGETYGKLTVLGFGEMRGRQSFWRCHCSCGNEKFVRKGNLKSGQTETCGSCNSKYGIPMVDLTGHIYGEWTVLGLGEMRGSKSYWRCQCSCGKERFVWGGNLRNGQSKSCRCNGGIRRQWAIGKLDRRECTSCKTLKTRHEFPILKGGLIGQKCCICDTEYQEKRIKRIDAFRTKDRSENAKARIAALDHYGGKCVCCGEATEVFLAFDHVNGGGSQHRKERTREGATNLPIWLYRKGFPAGFQILCNNCNWAKHRNQACPHQVESAVSAMSFGS